MLLLTRKKDEKIVIKCGKHMMQVIVADTECNRVRLAFNAPDKFEITREEIYAQRLVENQMDLPIEEQT